MFEKFKWLNQADAVLGEKSLIIKAKPKTDFFIDPADGARHLSGAYFYEEANLDFILKARVSHTFDGVYDACALMVMSDEACWAKICFELTDIGTHSVVSMVTNGTSDDANGVDLLGNTVYLQIAKQGHLFAMHYSLDGEQYKMTRYFSLPMPERFKVGFAAQSPLGNGGSFSFDKIQLDYREIKDIRNGL